MKKRYIPMLLLATLTLAGCNNNQDDSAAKNENAVINKLNDSGTSYAYAGVSSLDILNDAGEDTTTGDTTTGDTTTGDTTGDVTVDDGNATLPEEGTTVDEGYGVDGIDIDTANRYLSMYDKLTSGDSFSISNEESDDENYVYKVVAKSKDDNGVEKTYTLYFNEVVIGSIDHDDVEDIVDDVEDDIEDVTEEKDHDDVKDDLEDIIEDMNDVDDEDFDVSVDVESAKKHKHHDHHHEFESTMLEGVIKYDENTFNVKGRRIVSEYVTDTRFVTTINENKYISFSQTTNKDFTSYEYNVVERQEDDYFFGGHHHFHDRITNHYKFISYAKDDFNGVYFQKFADNKLTIYNFSSFVVDGQEYFEIVFFNDFTEYGYVYARVNYDEAGNKTYEYLFSKSMIDEHDDFWRDDDHDDEFEKENDFREHHGHHHGRDDDHHGDRDDGYFGDKDHGHQHR